MKLALAVLIVLASGCAPSFLTCPQACSLESAVCDRVNVGGSHKYRHDPKKKWVQSQDWTVYECRMPQKGEEALIQEARSSIK